MVSNWLMNDIVAGNCYCTIVAVVVVVINVDVDVGVVHLVVDVTEECAMQDHNIHRNDGTLATMMNSVEHDDADLRISMNFDTLMQI